MTFFAIVFGLFIFLIWVSSLVILWSGWDTLQLANKSRQWIATQGKIDSYKSQKVTRYVSTVGSVYGSNSKKVIRYCGKAMFSYRVGEVSYSGHIVDKQNYLTEEDAEQVVKNRHPIGSNITTFYNPSRPKESVLARGFTQARKNTIIVSLLYFSVGFNYSTGMLGAVILQTLLGLPSQRVDAFTTLFFKLGSVALCFWVGGYALSTMWYAINQNQSIGDQSIGDQSIENQTIDRKTKLSNFLFGLIMLAAAWYAFKFSMNALSN